MNNLLLQISGLEVSTKKDHVLLLNQISLDVPAGSFYGIVGESGSGKSLTALSVMKLLPPSLHQSGGEITFFTPKGTHNLTSLSEKGMNVFRGRHISMIFQEPMTSLTPSMTCGNQIEEVLKQHTNLRSGERKFRMQELMDEVKLPDPDKIIGSYPHQLSGGQRQRIMIAMAVAAKPELIIADEPTTALDVTVQKKIMTLLLGLKEKMGLTIIFISHDLRLIREYTDQVVVMRKGNIVEENTTRELLERPLQAYSRGLISCLPPMDSKPPRLLTIEDVEAGREAPSSFRPQISAKSNNVPVLSVRNLHVEYNTGRKSLFARTGFFKAVNSLSLDIFPGETLGLAGESGCGKTSLGKAILKLIEKSSGDIFYKGKSIADLTSSELTVFRKNVQVVFQDPYSSLNPVMTAGQMLLESISMHFPALSRDEKRKRAVDILLKTGLSESDLKKYPHEFSGGQRQRISIARALSTGPEFLVLDESVSALDVSVQAQILNLLNDLKDEFGLSYLFISHDLAVVKYMSDRIIIMKNGKIEEEGLPEDIFYNPVSDYTRELISSIPGNN